MKATNCHHQSAATAGRDHCLFERASRWLHRKDPIRPGAREKEPLPPPARRHLSMFLLPGYAHALPSVSDGGRRDPYPPRASRSVP